MVSYDKLNPTERKIWDSLEDSRVPLNTYQVIARLSEKDLDISYWICNKTLNIMEAKGAIQKIVTSNKKVLFKSKSIEMFENKEGANAN